MAKWSYDVFLSFRGEDSRRAFTSYLYDALYRRGFRTFLDNKRIQKGDDIKVSIDEAIEESRLAIPVFTEHYATSSFCLDEIAKIMECVAAGRQVVLPVFIDVEPTDVRHQKGSYGEAMAYYEKKYRESDPVSRANGMARLKKWKAALNKAADFSGRPFQKVGTETEVEFIERIVEDVSARIRLVQLHVPDQLVGLRPHVERVIRLLEVGYDDRVIMVGIHGIGGIGKTTLAKAVSNSIADSFKGSVCFLADVRRVSEGRDLVHLQKVLIEQLAGERNIEFGSYDRGIMEIKRSLGRKKVLLVVDDVDDLKQLGALAGSSMWFGPGSRVIITTRDIYLLAKHGVDKKYEVKELRKKEASELLASKAFENGKLDPSFNKDIFDSVVDFAAGLPLALEVIGSNLYGKSKEEWNSALEQYRRHPEQHIQQILKVSYDGLEPDTKSFFLDIACFFNRYRMEYVEEILCAHHGISPKYGIRQLVDKSLIKIDDGNVTLHSLVQDMGREVVGKEPGRCSRMWYWEDIKSVLEEDKGNGEINMIKLVFPKFDAEIKWDGEAFKKMYNLKTLIIGNARFSQGPKHLPNSLRVLEWQAYPSQNFPSDFYPRKLVILESPDSCLSSLNLLEQENFMNLRVLSFNWCQSIQQIPDVSAVPNLEELSFCWCKNVVDVHKSVGLLGKLRTLDAEGCSNLKSFPPIKLTNLESLDLSYCSSLESFPDVLEKIEKLTLLQLYNTSIKELPLSIRYLTGLQRLELWHSGSVQLPSSIFVLTELEHLSIGQCDELRLLVQEESKEQASSVTFLNREIFDFSGCNATNEFLEMGVSWFANVKVLHLSWNNFTILPAGIKECSILKELILDHCKNLQEVKGIPPNIEILSARDCTSLKDLDLTVLPATCILKNVFLDGCINLTEIKGIPPTIQVLNALKCTSLTSSCRSMLSNQELHKEGFQLLMPGTEIPEWFNHSCEGPAISFWFRNKFPATSLCIVSKQSFTSLSPKLIINDHEVHQFPVFFLEKDNILILTPGEELIKFKEADVVLSENEWNHAVLSNDPAAWKASDGGTMQIGLHVFEQSTSTEDIRFTEPPSPKEENRFADFGRSQTQFTKQQTQHLASLKPHVDGVNDLDAPRESSPAPSPTSSNGELSVREIYIEASWNAFPTMFDKSFGNEVPVIQDEAEMEAFYSFHDAETGVLSCSGDKSATTAPSDAREALKVVQEFIANDASVLLDSEQCSVMKASLDYLSNLSVDDGISEEEEALITEASWLFTHWSRDYTEASMKIEFVTSELQRADELEADLKANMIQFREVVASEKELLENFAQMEKSKKKLEEQINAIEANLSACESDRNMVIQRKRDIFEKGNILEAQIEELRKKVPHLQHELSLAKKTQEKITTEWSELGEKFKTIAVD